jgi:hypothetical protein
MYADAVKMQKQQQNQQQKQQQKQPHHNVRLVVADFGLSKLVDGYKRVMTHQVYK